MDRLLFDLNPSPVLIYDLDSLDILEANNAFKEKYGYADDELEGLTRMALRPAEDVDVLNKVLDDLDENGINKSDVVRHRSKVGEVFYVKVSSHSYPYNGKNARLVVIYDITDRVEAEEKAKRAFDELNHHVNHSPLAMIKWNSAFEVTQWSERAREITGFDEDAVLGKTPGILKFYEDDMKVVQKNMDYLLTGEGDKTKFEVKMYRGDGQLIDLRVHASVLRNAQNDIISVLTFIEDITEQKMTELRYQRLFENANDGIFIMKDGRFIECNQQVLEIYGCDEEDIIGATPADFSPEYQPDGEKSSVKAHRKIEKAQNGDPQVFEWKHMKKDGTLIDTEVGLNKLELVGQVYVQAIVRDLTKQKKAQQQIRRSEELFRKLFLKAPGAMIMVDKENRVKMVNQSFEELFGYTKEELVDKDLDEAIVSRKQRGGNPRMPGVDFKEGKLYKDVVRYTKSGEPRDVLLGAIPVFLDDEPIAGFGIYIDITEQKEYERKLKRSVEEKRVLLEEIHHRVKNNLAIISGFLQLQSFEIEDDKTREVLNDSQLRIQSIAIVHELLYQSKNFVDISFEEYLNRLIQTVKNTLPLDHQHIDINIDASGVSLDINQAIPCAILINELVTNAYKHAFNGHESGEISISLHEKDGRINVMVKDNGIGLPEGFDIRNQTSIGMNLIQTLTEQLDGNLEVCNDGGGCFKVNFEKTSKQKKSKLEKIGEME